VGGYGSGRQDGRVKTDEVPSLDVRRLHREGALEVGKQTLWTWWLGGEETLSIRLLAQSHQVVLRHGARVDGKERTVEYPIGIEKTPCHFGGTRTWFRCPSPRCGRRVAVLYQGRFFACRHCQRLVYASQSERREERLDRKADKLRERLGWDGDLRRRPRGMRRRTYERLRTRYSELVALSVERIRNRFTG
jgi:hypothetical protein